MKYISKIELDAVRWDGERFSETLDWMAGFEIKQDNKGHCTVIANREGGMKFWPGDYLVRDWTGECYSVPSWEFEKYYRPKEVGDAEG